MQKKKSPLKISHQTCIQMFDAKSRGRKFFSTPSNTFELVFNSDPRSSTPKVMRPGRGCPKKPAIAAPRIVIKYYTESRYLIYTANPKRGPSPMIRVRMPLGTSEFTYLIFFTPSRISKSKANLEVDPCACSIQHS